MWLNIAQKNFQLIVAKSLCMNQTLISVREYLIASRNKTILLMKAWKDCSKIRKFSLPQYQTHFKWCHKRLPLFYRAPVYSYSQPVHNTQNYVFQNYQMIETLNTPLPHSHNTLTLCPQHMMKHILQLEME